jgi:hypothetical protein
MTRAARFGRSLALPALRRAVACAGGTPHLLKSSPVRATVRAAATDPGQVTAELAKEDPEVAQRAAGPDRAGLVEDRQEEMEHQEFEEVWTSCLIGGAFGSGCMVIEWSREETLLRLQCRDPEDRLDPDFRRDMNPRTAFLRRKQGCRKSLDISRPQFERSRGISGSAYRQQQLLQE